MTPRLSAVVSRTVPRNIRKDPARIVLSCIFAIIFLFLLPGPVRSADSDWTPLVERLAADGFNRPAMEALFARPEVRFEPDAMAGKIKALVRDQSVGPDSPAAQLKNAVRRDYLNRWTIARARAYST